MSYLKKSSSAILAEQNINVVSSISSIYPNRSQAKTLLNVIWRLPKYVNQVGLLSRSTGIELDPILWRGKLMIFYQLVRSFHETHSPSFIYRRV